MGKTYDTYKDSGIPWIGEIPEGWEVMKIKRVLKNKSEKGHPNETVLSLYRDYGVIPKDSRDDNHNVTSEDTWSYKYVEIGNFVINKMKSWQGSMAVSSYSGIISPAYYVCMFTRNDIEKKYIHYLLRNESYKTEYLRLSTGMRIGQWDLNIESFLNIEMILPPLSEQQAIASYLDEKCADIDELVSLQEEMIKELKAYKQSIITEAVTKGLDPNVPMKDSGIPWIGEIPEGWSVSILSSIFSEHKCLNTESLENNLLSLSYGKIKRKDINTIGGLLPESFNHYNIVEKGDIVLRLTDLQNDKRSLRTGLCKEKGIITSAYVTIRNRGNDNCDYMHYLLHVYDICKVYYGMGNGVRQGINYSDIRSLKIIIPPLSEQQAISSYLDEKCADIDELISLRKKKIEELKEYKKSVIFEVVTGKIKVD